nr:hypothetical protein [Xenococcus sp. PCC 7305]
MLCQITSQNINDLYSVAITNADFSNGGLNKNSNIRPNRIFIAQIEYLPQIAKLLFIK